MNVDVIIIGGGPGGAALGCYLSKLGISNCILESAIHPREHVGESMVTATTRIFEEIGFLETMEREKFVRKYGASWHSTTHRDSLHVEFSELAQEGIHQDYTYHVDRSKFDLLLLKHAESAGSSVCQGVCVNEVVFEEDKAIGVNVTLAGQKLFIPAKIVVDASGRKTVLGSQLGIKRMDPNFNQFAVHTWFEGVNRGNRPDDIHIYFLPLTRGWIWQIPITEEITSIGVVIDKKLMRKGHKDREAMFYELANVSPDVAEALAHAKPVQPFKVEADYSYQMESLVGNGWMLVGDAARFVDPIFSSGVSVAMHSAKFCSQQIKIALDTGDMSRGNLQPYETRMKRGITVWYEFIVLYYKLRLVFTRFMAKEEHRLQIIQLLQGDVYTRDQVPVLDAMRRFVAQVESTEGHLLQSSLDPELTIDQPQTEV